MSNEKSNEKDAFQNDPLMENDEVMGLGDYYANAPDIIGKSSDRFTEEEYQEFQKRYDEATPEKRKILLTDMIGQVYEDLRKMAQYDVKGTNIRPTSVATEVFIKLSQYDLKVCKYRTLADFMRLFHRSMRNIVIDRIRREKHAPKPVAGEEISLEDMVPCSPTFLVDLTNSVFEVVQKNLENSEDFEMLMDRFFEELSYQEIAEKWAKKDPPIVLKPDAIRMRLRRICASLKEVPDLQDSL